MGDAAAPTELDRGGADGAPPPPAVQMRGITKRFPGVVANDGVDFEAAAGEVHALLGENGAGKSTLSNILTGLYRPDEGEIFLYGRRVEFHAPRDALEVGIGMVHQHFRLVEPFTVAENVVLGDHRGEGRAFRLRRRAIERRVAELSKRYGLAVEPRARIWQLSLGEQQRVEILKALYREARVLILDEPTAVLTPQEAEARGGAAVRGVSLAVRGGEIVAVAGVAGNGQGELGEAVAGIRPPTEGAVRVGGKTLRRGDPRAAIGAGVAYVPEDRLGAGGAPNLSIASNLALKSYRERSVSRGPLLRLRRIRDRAIELIRRYRIAAPGPHAPARLLSGGNLQKVVLAREFSVLPKLLVAASPTRGLDVGAIETVHEYLRDAAGEGVAILLISEDLDEILTLADRIAVMYEGAILGETTRADASVEEIGLLMAGGHDPRAD